MEFFNDLGGDALRPSLFELIAQEQLRDLLQPSLKYVLSVFAQRYPRYLLRIVNRHEELYAAVMFFVERHYLRKHNASFSENFYGLKRRRRPWVEPLRTRAAIEGFLPEEKLRDQDIQRSLLFLVGIPYVRAKAQDYYEQLGGGLELESGVGDRQSQGPQGFAGRLRHAFRVAYPWLNTTFELWLLVCNVAYLFDRTPSYRPWWSWINVDIRRLGVEDFRMASNASQNKRPSLDRRRGLVSFLLRAIFSSPKLLFDSLRLLLPTAIFFVKFLEWWYSPSSPARSLATSPLGPAVPPPRMLQPHPMGISMDGVNYGQCPICHNHTNNATALPSGYVFCYRCAHEQVEKHGKCPVTLLPAKVWQLRKVLV